MSIMDIASGQAPLSHVLSAATLGEGLSQTVVWVMSLHQIVPPSPVVQFITGCSIGVVSVSMMFIAWLTKKLS
jgi:hypothetical protein